MLIIERVREFNSHKTQFPSILKDWFMITIEKPSELFGYVKAAVISVKQS